MPSLASIVDAALGSFLIRTTCITWMTMHKDLQMIIDTNPAGYITSMVAVHSPTAWPRLRGTSPPL
jgi:hypothetical protein